MTPEEAIHVADEALLVYIGLPLTDIQRMILRDSMAGRSYESMKGYAPQHIKNEGKKLWDLLSEALGEKVSKKNFKGALEKGLKAYTTKCIDSHHDWIGREKDLEALNRLIGQGTRAIAIYGKGGVGKTTLAEKLFDLHHFKQSDILEIRIAKEIDQVEPIENILDDWIQQKFKQNPGRTLGAKLDQIKKNIRYKKTGILIDNIETILDEKGEFTESFREYVELLRVLTGKFIESILLVTSRERICESEINLEAYRLEGLSCFDWKKFFSIRNVEVNKITLDKIHEAYGGNTKAMRIIAADVYEFEDNLDHYWQENGSDFLQGELKNLVFTQFERLQKLDIQAYYLLCRLGLYRYQDIPRVSQDGLSCLLWDVPEDSKRKIIVSLRNRDLLEFKNGEYWLHPVIQVEAITRIKSEDDFVKTHQEIGRFYFKSINKKSEDLVQTRLAFEAFYHFYKARSFEYCSKTLLSKILGAEGTHLENLRCSVNIWNYTSRILELGQSILEHLKAKEKLLTLIPIGVCYSDLGQNFKALSVSQEILKICADLNSLTEEIVFAKIAAYSIAGRANRLIGKFPEALNACESATKIASRSKQPQLKALALYELGRAYLDSQKPGRALRCFVIAAFQAVGMKVTEEIYQFSDLLFLPIQDLSERLERILDRYEPGNTESNNIKKFRITYSIAQCFNLMPLSVSPLASFFSRKALKIAEETDISSTTWAYLELAIYYDRIGDKRNAEEYYLKSESNLVDEDETFVVVTVLRKMADWYCQENRLSKALEKYKELEEEIYETDFLYLKAYMYYGFSVTYRKLGSLTLAFQACEHALAIANDLNLSLAHECQSLKDQLLRGADMPQADK